MQGKLIDATAEYGNSLPRSGFDYVRMTGGYGIVRPAAPDGWGYFSKARLALRAYGGWA